MVKKCIYEDDGDSRQRAAALLAELPAGARTTKLPGDELPWDVRFTHIGDVRVIQAYDPIANKMITRYDVEYECTLPKQKAHTGK